jgi:hypothetical protein
MQECKPFFRWRQVLPCSWREPPRGYRVLRVLIGGTLELGDSFNGTVATLLPTGSVLVSNGSTLMLDSATGQTNVLGAVRVRL